MSNDLTNYLIYLLYFLKLLQESDPVKVFFFLKTLKDLILLFNHLFRLFFDNGTPGVHLVKNAGEANATPAKQA